MASYGGCTCEDCVSDAIKKAVEAERERCAMVADKWAKDDLQSGEIRLVAAYIRHSIRSGK